MALRNIVERGDEILAKKCREVKEVNDHIRMILDDMLDTMREAQGVGIAAPQVGINRRMFIVEVDGETYEMINPVML
ncbi:MAG: peptide deformylase, partial [Firmicutes bacterium]|nr:peptide deformylase [Bacillota bacterium]